MAWVDILTEAEWLLVARKYLREDNTDKNDMQLLEIRPAAETGAYGGFLGDSLPVRVRISLANGTHKVVPLFLKTVATDCHAHAEMCRSAFRKEVCLYEKIFPRMRNLPPLAPGESAWAPEVFFTRHDLLVMEDLVEQGFVERDRRRPFDFDHVALALAALGRFHASTWLLEEREAATLDSLFPEALEESFFVETPKNTLQHCFFGGVRALAKALPLIPQVKSSPDFERVLKKFPKIIPKMIELMRPSKKNRNVMNHGDLWSNNILFRYEKDETSSPPTDVRLLDFQLVRYAPPAVDVNLLVYLTTRPELRRARGGDMLRRYHSSLRDALARGGADVDDFLTWEQLVATCDEYHHVGIITAPFYHHVSLIDPERLKGYMSPDSFEEFIFNEPKEVMADSLRDDEYYRKKIGEEIVELVESVVIGNVNDFWKRAVERTS